jgi:tRNA A-37 threonylcarbamoyl transferase component Bud32
MSEGGMLAQCLNQLDRKMTSGVLNFCKHIAGSGDLVAACLSSDVSAVSIRVGGVADVLAVISGYVPRLMNFLKPFDGRNVLITAVDAWVFERDVDKGFLGEVLAGRMIFPYVSLVNAGYFQPLEVKLKKRLVLELLENLVLDYPELSYELRIKPEYFMYEAMITRARVFPLLNYLLLQFSREECKEANVGTVLPGYLLALSELEREQKVHFSDGYVRISPEFIMKVRSGKARFINLLKSGQRALFSSLLGSFPQVLNALSQNSEFLSRFQRAENPKFTKRLHSSDQYLFLPIDEALVPLSDSTDIAEYARRIFGAESEADIKIEELGGILNDVFLVRVAVDHDEKRVVAKRYRDWSSVKWFPLTLWSVGTRSFVVLGRSRLERECAMNQFLRSKGFKVPKIFYVSGSERLIFMEYIEGETLSRIVKKAAVAKTLEAANPSLDVIEKAGALLAKVHAENVVLGDTKPENLLLSKTNDIIMLDFEQASRYGDKAWDVAEFIYYAGHYAPIFIEIHRAEMMAKAFIRGYINSGGEPKVIRGAGTPKYTKVFSIFTPPHVMLAYSALCRKTGKEESDNHAQV